MNNKTTITGIIGAVFALVQPILSNGTFDFSKDWKNIIIAIVIGAMGYFAKDHDVTGGTTVNTKNDASVVATSAKLDKGV